MWTPLAQVIRPSRIHACSADHRSRFVDNGVPALAGLVDGIRRMVR
jgi:hypothetical protein